MDIDTDLIFKGTDEEIIRMLAEIQQVAEKSKIFKKTAIDPCREIHHKTEELYSPFIHLDLYLKDRINQRLSALFGELKDPEMKNLIDIRMSRYEDLDSNPTDYWRAEILGRNICHPTQFMYAMKYDDYEDCLCPKKFRDFCVEMGEILKKYHAFRDI